MSPVHADHIQNLAKKFLEESKLKNCSWFPFNLLHTSQSLEAAAVAAAVPQLQNKLTKEGVGRAERLRGRSRTKKKKMGLCNSSSSNDCGGQEVQDG